MKKEMLVAAVVLALIASLGGFIAPVPAQAWNPTSYYSPTKVDGNISEWNLTNDFFANMYRAGRTDKPLESKAYLRYDCVPNTMYVLVLTEMGIPALAGGWETSAWAAIGSVSNKVYTGLSGNDGTPPDFAWVGLSGDGKTALGYEASFQLDPGNWEIMIHIEVFDSSASQTSAIAGFPKVMLPFQVICLGIHPLAIHVNKYISLDNQATWIEATIPPGPTVVEGSEIYIKIRMKNSVDIPLYDLTLTDTVFDLSGVDLPDYLAPEDEPGDSFEVIIGPITASIPGLYHDLATDSGSNPAGTPQTDSESQDLYYTVVPQSQGNPSIAVQKYVSEDDLTYVTDVPWPSVEFGYPVWFKLVVTNTGDVTLDNITLVDDLYDISEIFPPLPSPFTLEPGVSYYGVIGPVFKDVGNYTNTATATGHSRGSSYQSSDSASFETTSGLGGTIADMFISKTDSPDPVIAGADLAYTITVTNNGPADATGVSMTDTLPAGVTLISWDTHSTGSFSHIGGAITWDGFNLTSGSSATLDLVVTVDSNLPDGSSLDNTATVNSSTDDPFSDDNTVTATTHITSSADLSIAKTADQLIIYVGDTAAYTITIHNAGPSDAYNVAVTDSLPAGITWNTTTPGATIVGGELTYSTSTLAAGATVVIQVSGPTTAANAGVLTNTATVTSTNGGTDGSTATITVNALPAPVIQVEKSGPASATVGEGVTYSITVTHDASSDGSPVGEISVTDSLGGAATYVSGDDGDNILESGETWNYTAEYTIQATDISPLENTATASGTDEHSNPVSDDDTHSLDIVYAPLILVDKSGPASATVGETITYTITVTHDPGSDGSPVQLLSVDDSLGGPATYVSGDDGDDLLESGEMWNYTVEYTVPYSAPSPLENTATATGKDGDGDTITDSDTHSLDVVYAPVLVVDKTGSASATVGEEVTYIITVKHDVSSDLSPVLMTGVEDDIAGTASYTGGDADSNGKLDAGETWTYEVEYTIQATDGSPLENTATATGTDKDGDPVSGNDEHSLDIIYNPLIVVEKSGPASATVGEGVTYTIEVTHDPGSDGSAVSDLSVNDSLGGLATYVSGDNGDNILESGETWNYTAEYTLLATDGSPLENTATATGTDKDGDPVSDSDEHSLDIIYNPLIVVEKSGPATAHVGETITYTITVTHDPGSDGSPVQLLSVTDSLGGPSTYVSGDDGDDLLESGETWNYTVEYTVLYNTPSPLENTATATGKDGDGDTITDSDTHSLDVVYAPVLVVDKTGSASATVGEEVTYIITVKHDVSSDLSPVLMTGVEDDIAGIASYTGGDADSNGKLDAGETWTYEVEYTIQATDGSPLENTATATGTDKDGDPVSDSDGHSLDIVYAPLIVVEKSGPASATVGEEVTYTITVTHDPGSDGSAVSDLSVDDSLGGPATYVSGDDGDNILEFGETWNYTAEYTIQATDGSPLENTATATGKDGDNDTVTDSDGHSLDIVYAPLIVVEKSGPASATVGEEVTYTITVTHDPGSDGSPVQLLSVTDSLGGPSTYVNGDDGDDLLESGETWNYTVEYTVPYNTPSLLENTATATGKDGDGDTITDSDTHSLDVVYAPVLVVDKTGSASATVGEEVTYIITVKHDVSSDLSPVLMTGVEDDIAGIASYTGGDADSNGKLDAGETWTYEVEYTIQATDGSPLENTATATGTDKDGDPVSANDEHSLDIIYNPSILVKKSGPASATVGEEVTYTITVTHDPGSDGSAVSDLSVNDSLGGPATYVSGDDGDNILEFGETWNYTAEYTIQATDGSPLENTATAYGTDEHSNPVSDSDGHSLDIVYAPLIVVEKSGPATAHVGETIMYTISVQHDPGSDGSPVQLLSVTDSLGGLATYVNGDDGDDLLESGETWNYTVEYTVLYNTPSPLENTATATGKDGDGDTITDSDTHSLDVVYAPVLVVDKTGSASATVGEEVTYIITVKHDVSSDLSPVLMTGVEDDIAGIASYTGGDADSNGKLDAGETWTYEVEYTVQATDGSPLENTATATGTDKDGDPVSGSDEHSLDIIYNPLIVVEKSGPASATVGEEVTYTITVTHDPGSDGSAVSDLSVNDSLGGPATYVSGDDGDNILESGETWNYTADYTIQATDGSPLENTATATGKDGDGDTITDSDDHSLNIVYAPLIVVEKSGPATAHVGETITYTITVTHDPGSDGSPVQLLSVTDSMGGPSTYVNGDDGDDLLESGETWNYTVEYTVPYNTPSLLENTATATGKDGDGDTITDSDTHSLDVVYAPVLVVDKTGSASATVGEEVTYIITVKHDVSSDLSPVLMTGVEDDIAGIASYTGGDADSNGKLDAGETWTYEVEYTVQATDGSPLENTATATGTDKDGDPVSGSDEHSLDIIYNPLIVVEKSGPASATVGEEVTYTITVTHDPGSDKSPVLMTGTGNGVVDNIAGAANYQSGDADNDGYLDYGETWNYTAEYTVQATDGSPLENTATATGKDGDNDTVTNSDEHSLDIVYAPLIVVEKSGPASATVGEEVTYTITVKHDPGSDGSPVQLLSVTDSLGGPSTYVNGDDGDDLLESGETWNYTVEYTLPYNTPSPLENTATATGKDGDGDTITDSDTHSLDVVYAPVLVVDKTGSASATVGEEVTYIITVKHDVSSDLSPVLMTGVEDDIAGIASYTGGDADSNGKLDAGETWTYEVEYTVQATDGSPLENTATATGTDKDGDPVSGSDEHSLDIIYNPLIVVEKSGPASATVGEEVTYTITVTHDPGSDGSAVSDLSVNDSLGGPATYVSGDDGDNILEFGETWNYTAEYTIQATDGSPLENTATATGKDGDGETITDSDTHSLDVVYAPVLLVEKTGPATAHVGETITYTITVKHDPTSDFSPVLMIGIGNGVVDNIAGAATYKSGDTAHSGYLDAGETWHYTAPYTIKNTDPDALENTAIATGKDLDGDTVTGSDSHSLNVAQTPNITLAKSGVFNDENSDGYADVGETITYTFTLTNIGNMTLYDVNVTDPKMTVEGGPTTLDVGEVDSTTFSGTYALTQADLDAGRVDNTAIAAGTTQAGSGVTAIGYSRVIVIDAPSLNPGISIVKNGTLNMAVVYPNTRVNPGDVIHYTFTVTNKGDVRLTGVIVSDPLFTVNGSPITLEVGESNSTHFKGTYILTQADIDAGKVENTAMASGVPFYGPAVTDTDSETVTLLQVPSLSIVKNGELDKTLVDPDQQADPGDVINYTFTVTNTGNVTLIDVMVADLMIMVYGSPITLAPGESDSSTFYGSYTITQSDIDAGRVHNMAFVQGTSAGNGTQVSDDDSNDLPIENPVPVPASSNLSIGLSLVFFIAMIVFFGLKRKRRPFKI